MKFPAHIEMHITHNPHKGYYETVERYLSHLAREEFKTNVSKEDITEMIATDSIWEIQVYPNTPIGFNFATAATLERAISLVEHDSAS